MPSTSDRRLLAGVGAVLVMILVMACSGTTGLQALPTAAAPTTAQSAPSSAASSQAPTTQGNSSSAQVATPDTAPAIQVVPPLANPNVPYTISLQTKRTGAIPSSACKGPVKVSRLAVPNDFGWVYPPEPKQHDWCDTTVWPSPYVYPQAPSTGTFYVYGHSCEHHDCTFSDIKQFPSGGFTVMAGDTATVTTSNGVLTYTVCNVGLSSKKAADGNLQVPPCGATLIDLVIVTCYIEDGISDYNIVVAATLTTAKPKS